jgi:hypothetical protein
VLVVGDTVAGHAAARRLARVTDCLHVAGPGGAPPSGAPAVLSPGTRRALAALPGPSVSDALRSVEVQLHADESARAARGRAFACDRERLRRTLARGDGPTRRLDRHVVEVSAADDAAVRFENGVRERFDAVVVATGDGGLAPGADGTPVVTRWFDADAGAVERVSDHWSDAALVSVASFGDRTTVETTTAGSAPSDLDAEFDRNGAVPALSDSPLRTERGRHSEEGTWRRGRVAFVGAAARPLAPGCGLDLPLALEDGAAVATALETERPRVALARYAATRERRAAALVTVARETAARFGPRDALVGPVVGARALALAPVMRTPTGP